MSSPLKDFVVENKVNETQATDEVSFPSSTMSNSEFQRPENRGFQRLGERSEATTFNAPAEERSQAFNAPEHPLDVK